MLNPLKPGVFLDTFEESFRNNMFLFFFAISSLFIGSIALALNMDIVSGAISGVTFFGEELEIPRMTVPQFINAVQSGMAMMISTIGLFLALMATSTLFPLMTQKGSIELLLCRPVPRWRLMVARFLGGTAIMALNAGYLIAGVWLVLGLKSGIWNTGFPASTILIVIAFVFLYSAVMTLSVMTENGPVGLLAGYAILMFSPVLAAHERITPAFSKELYREIFRSLYWVLPKVAEMIGAARRLIAGTPLEIGTVLWTSGLFTAGCFLVTLIYFSRRDY